MSPGLAVWLSLVASTLPNPKPAPAEKGMALGLFSADTEYDYAPLIREIAELGTSHLSITQVWWQQNVGSNEIKRVEGWTASDRQVLRSITEARRLGMHVTLFPIVRLVERGPKQWRGKIEPEDEGAWWDSYSAFILHHARLARRAGAERFSVGSELLSRERMRGRWIELIDRVRAEAPNIEILYSANWDHYQVVSFWDRVDIIGLTGYWELAKGRSEPEVPDLVRAWEPVQDELEAFSKRVGRPLVLTEIGYPSIEGCAAQPWNETRTAEIDLEAQRRAYAAFVDAWAGRRFLRGVYWWNWFGFGGAKDGDYTPRGKPAAEVIERWYRAQGAKRGTGRSSGSLTP